MSGRELSVFTDGSCTNNGRANSRAGIGIVFPNNESVSVSEPFELGLITNQRAELYAILKALQLIQTHQPYTKLNIYTDSLYSIKCLSVWTKGWIANGWKSKNRTNVKNKDLIQSAWQLIQQFKSNGTSVQFHHVRAHTGALTWEATWNAMADQLAQSAQSTQSAN